MPKIEHDCEALPPIAARLRQLLGTDAITRLTAALQSSGPRFAALRLDGRATSVQPIVFVVVELLEVMAAGGMSEDQWPSRWHDGAAVALIEPRALRHRAFNALGPFATTRVSRAIGRDRERIQKAWAGASPRLANDLAAVVELLETVAATGRALPPRWGTGAKSLPAPRLVRTLPEGHDVKSRFVAILGDGVSSRLARAIDAKPDHIRATFAGRQNGKTRARPRPAVVAILELLEVLKAEGIPEERWPERWHRAARKPPGRRPKQSRDVAASPATGSG